MYIYITDIQWVKWRLPWVESSQSYTWRTVCRTQTMKVYIPVTYSIHSDTLRLTLPSTVRQLLI